ncbi:unnamed protein product [Parnassius mnemosyne]|uniref:Transposase n=1 Tax=Parnassius mnemosyne TaxID=213953 RepID=A0AAV1KCH5_9NEOP
MPRINFRSLEYTDMVLIDGECHQNASLALRTYRERYNTTRVCPTDSRIFIRAVQRLRDGENLIPRQVEIPPRVAVAQEEQILNYFARNPTSSLRRAARQFCVHHKSVHRILKKNKQRPFKYVKVQALLDRDKPVREAYCEWLLSKVANDSNFLANVMWTDESTFMRNGIWNRQNLRYWSQENPQLCRESMHQYRFAVNVWDGIHGDQIIVFLPERLNGQRYLNFINEQLVDILNDLSLAEYRRTWFQHDGAPPHFVRFVRERLNELFDDRWIGRLGPHAWPPRSPDLTPLDFFLWGMYERVFNRECDSAEEMRLRIVDAFEKLRTDCVEDHTMMPRLHPNLP